jgi:hypothetical protein
VEGGGSLGDELYLQAGARVSDPNQDGRLARVGLLGSRAGLGPLAQATKARIYQVFLFFCFVLPIMMFFFKLSLETYNIFLQIEFLLTQMSHQTNIIN